MSRLELRRIPAGPQQEPLRRYSKPAMLSLQLRSSESPEVEKGAGDMTEGTPVPEGTKQHPAWARLEDQLGWYDKKSDDNQKRYKQIKVAQLVLAGTIPVFALVGDTWGRWVTAILGASVAILEGLQQLGQYNNLWVSYRATAEQLKHEKYLFLAHSAVRIRVLRRRTP